MGNCLRPFFGEDDTDEIDAALISDNEGNNSPNLNYYNNSSSSDEAPLFGRILSRQRRSSRSRRNRRQNRTQSSHSRSYAPTQEYVPRAEQHQILLAQRLGLIQHLPQIVWKGPPGHASNETRIAAGDLSEGARSSGVRDGEQDSSVTLTPMSSCRGRRNSNLQNNDNRTTSRASDLVDQEVPEIQPPTYEKTGIIPPQPCESPKNEEKASIENEVAREELECTICMEEFEQGNVVRYLPCMHYYHQQCIDDWLMRSFTCPRCMEAVDSALMSTFAQQLS